MGIFSRSKNKKLETKIGGYPHEPKKAVEQPKVVEQKKQQVTSNPISTTTTTVTSQKPNVAEKVEKKPAMATKVPDPNLEFQMMYGLADTAENLPPKVEKNVGKAPAHIPEHKETVEEVKTPVHVSAPKATVPEAKPTVVDGISEHDTVIIPNGGFRNYKKPFFAKPVKRLVNKHLTIILVENTETMAKEKDKVIQLVKNFATPDMVCIINYGETVSQSEIFEFSTSDNPNISCNEMTGEKSCFFDALVQLEKIVSSKYFTTEERETENVLIDSITVIGIGTGRDNCSVAPKEEALNCFQKVASKTKVINKYFCLTDEYFINAAEIGFHSIGAICRDYQ